MAYRPIYNCLTIGFEPHTITVTCFERWEEQFEKVEFNLEAEEFPLSVAVVENLLEGPSWKNKSYSKVLFWKFK